MAVAAHRDTRMRVAEYRDWIAPRPDCERWELLNGVPVRQEPQPGRHQRIVTNLLLGLGDLADDQGGSAYPGLAILNPAMDFWVPYPDVVVQSMLTDGDGYISDPLLIAEVLSPSTLVLDRGRKTEFYQSVPSLAVLLLVHQDEARVEVWRRTPNWTVHLAGPGANIDLPELGGSLTVTDIYARLTL